MDFLEKTYVDNSITFYIDVAALSAELEIRRGKEGVQNIVFTKSGVSFHIDIGTTTGGSDVGFVYDGRSLTYTPTQDITLYCKEAGGGSSD